MHLNVYSLRKSLRLSFPLIMLALKPFADMLWQFQILDAVILIALVAVLAYDALRSPVKCTSTDVLIILLMSMFFASYLRDVSGFTTLVKIESAFLLYFVGRDLYWLVDDFIYNLLFSYGIVIVVNYVTMALGKGYQYWGAAYTFSGLYFFKTDLASAATMAFTFFLYWGKNGLVRLIALGSSTLLVVLSNARAYYIALMLVILVYVFYKRGNKINLRIVFSGLIGGIVILYLLNWVFSTGLFNRFGFIGIKFNRFSDLLDASNTQGRNYVWTEILRRLRSSGIKRQAFGIDLVSDMVMVNGGVFGSHSLYIGSIYNIGIVGLSVLLVFIVMILSKLRVIQDRFGGTYPYFVLSLITTFLVAGISVHTLQYTPTSWLPMLFSGIAVSMATYARLPAGTEGVY